MVNLWYALAVQPRKESYVEKRLKSDGYSVAWPRFLKTTLHARRSRRVAASLFPGYLFVQLDLSRHSWRQVNWTPGTIGLVKFGDQPTPLDDGFVSMCIRNLPENGIIEFEQSVEVGDRVRAVGGPFDRFMGEVIDLPNEQRVKVLFDALNRKVETTLPRKSVVVAA